MFFFCKNKTKSMKTKFTLKKKCESKNSLIGRLLGFTSLKAEWRWGKMSEYKWINNLNMSKMLEPKLFSLFLSN